MKSLFGIALESLKKLSLKRLYQIKVIMFGKKNLKIFI
jgi:hypothetical protein